MHFTLRVFNYEVDLIAITSFLFYIEENIVMVSTEITILARSSFVTKDVTGKDIQETRITYQLNDGRIGTVVIPTNKINTKDEDTAIAASVKALPGSSIERRSIDIV